jgi:hypothetical protein
MSDENRAIAVIPVRTGEIRNKTVNMLAIQLAELGVVLDGYFCRELHKGTKTAGCCITAKELANLTARQMMPIFVENSNK